MPALSTPARTLLTKRLESGNFIAAVNAKTKDHLPDGVFEKDPEETAKIDGAREKHKVEPRDAGDR